MTIEQQAAQNLINQAMTEIEFHAVDILIEAAHGLDSTIDKQAHKVAWMKIWAENNKNRSKS